MRVHVPSSAEDDGGLQGKNVSNGDGRSASTKGPKDPGAS